MFVAGEMHGRDAHATQLFLQIPLVAIVDEAFFLEEVDEHQPVQHDARQPGAVILTPHMAGGQLEAIVECLVIRIELFRDALDIKCARPLRDPIIDTGTGRIEIGEFRQVVIGDGFDRITRSPSEAGQRGSLVIIGRGAEMREAVVLVVVRADEQQVFTVEGGKGWIAPAVLDEAVEELAQRAGESTAGGEHFRAIKFQNENAPRTVRQDDLPDFTGGDLRIEFGRADFARCVVVRDILDGCIGGNRPIEGGRQQMPDEGLAVDRFGDGGFDVFAGFDFGHGAILSDPLPRVLRGEG